MDDHRFDVVLIGSGFGSMFFLHRFLAGGAGRVLIVEWGRAWDHAEQIAQGRNTPIAAEGTFVSRPTPDAKDKFWNFTIGLGGGTNCWFAQTPRPQPSDFELHTRFGTGQDWPVNYDELEPYLSEAEMIMSVSGDPDMMRLLPRSQPFPQPPHRLSSVDRLMKAAQPDHHFAMPTARARVATPRRPACCASLRCNLCPVNAKFTALNDLSHLFEHQDVSVMTGARARRLEKTGSTIDSVIIERDGREDRVFADLFVLGANAIHSPAILQASGLADDTTGRWLHESQGAWFEVSLVGVDNFDGSTITTGINYSLADGPFRKDRAATLLYFENRWTFGLRTEPGRWRQTLPMIVVAEETPSAENRVTLGPDGEVVVAFGGPSEYAKRGVEFAAKSLPDILSPLPVEAIQFKGYRGTESHLQGTLRMGLDPATSVVDPSQVHHRFRNLIVVGSSVFPTCLTANPSLTVAALSLRAAAQLLGDSE